jgi:predicted NBD/HSP70 family sugar kinase
VPGVVKKNIAVWCPHTGWQNFDFAPTIAAAFDCPVWLENDANLAGLAETRALPTIPDGSLYVTVSTGIGTGIIIDGQIAPGLAQSEGGHIRIEYDGRLRDWDSFASGKAIVETYGKYAKDIHDKKTWKQIADKISRGLVTIVPILQPDVIIIGGSVGTYFERYETPLRQLMKEHMPPHIDIPLLRKAQHPEEAVVYGCYHYAKDKLSR